MATILQEFDFTQPGIKHARSKGYPWGDWFDGRIWQITEGEDFPIEPLMMERQLRTRASPLRLSISIRHTQKSPGVIVFQATPLEAKTEKPQQPIVQPVVVKTAPAYDHV